MEHNRLTASVFTPPVFTPPGPGAPANSSYTDIRGLQTMEKDSPEALRRVAAQFESLFMDMWLKSMREAGSVFSDDNPFSSASVKVHEEMLDHQYALNMSEAGGIGIGDALVAQLSRNLSNAEGEAEVGALPARVQFALPQSVAGQLDVKSMGSKREAFSGIKEFVDKLLPVVKGALEGTSLNPLAVLAQAALETGWGQKVIHDGEGASSHNLFGIKAADWQGPSASVMSMEFDFESDRMTPRQSDFRAYQSFAESVTDYVDFLRSNDRYREVIEQGADVEQFARELQQSGYATDPNYADKLLAVAKRVAATVSGL